MHHLIDNLNWRYATKKFDSTKKVDADKLAVIREAIRLAATSYGLQPFRIIEVTDSATREKLKEAAYGQSQLTDADRVFIFAAKTDMDAAYVDGFMQLIAETRGAPLEALEGYAKVIKGQISGMSSDVIEGWNKRQAYIALGHLLIAAAEVKVDACPMEGFDAGKFDEILGLKDQGLTTAVIAPVGHRHADDALADAAKVRLAEEVLFITK